ncbi:hypothetical protein JC525_09530 [Alteromonas sp. IB21]|uniref:hypothetical protein n=1 Tax=Alteromonas sp. IB21 TaxID=2779369 RepID=UPI0018E7FDA8|nr:hypothetical protein [Alteromonas sp. IB21]MBJ2129179.1 hypothetical protein [Alteromonas sp. IB21]
MQYAHGEFIVTRCGSAIVTQAYGPWNRECVTLFAKDYREKAESLFGQTWCNIVCVSGESLLVPDAEASLRERTAAMHPLGLTHIALVMGDSSVKATTTAQLKRVYRDLNIDTFFVNVLTQAVEWLTEKGFSIEQEGISDHLKRVALK